MSVSRLKWWEQSPFCVSTRHCSLSLFRMALSLVSDRVLTYMLSALLCIRRPPRSLGFSLWAALAPGFSVLSTLVAFVSLYFQRHRPNSESLSEKKKKKESLSGSTTTLLPCAAAAWKLWRQWTWTLVGLTSFVFHLSRITVFHHEYPVSRKPLFCLFVCFWFGWFLGWFVVLFIWLFKVVGQIQSPLIHFS